MDNFDPISIGNKVILPMSEIWVWWIICIVIIYYLIKLFVKYVVIVDKHTVKKYQTIRNIPFCYLYKTVEELKTYLINERRDHLVFAKKNFLKYLDDCEFYQHPLVSKVKDKIVSFTLESIAKKYNWVELSSKTKEISKCITQLQGKVLSRIDMEEEVEILKDALVYLLQYEFLKTKSKLISKIYSDPKQIESVRDEFIMNFVRSINNLEVLSETDIVNKKQSNIFTNLGPQISKLFMHDSILILFASWYFLVLILLLTTLYIGMSIFIIEVDSKILIGLLTTPFIGAITITIGVLNYRKK